MPLLTHLFLRKKSATVWLWVSFLLPGSVLLVLPAVVPLLSTLQGEILAIKPLTSSAAACWTGVSKFGSKSVVLSYACNPYWYSTKKHCYLIKHLARHPQCTLDVTDTHLSSLGRGFARLSYCHASPASVAAARREQERQEEEELTPTSLWSAPSSWSWSGRVWGTSLGKSPLVGGWSIMWLKHMIWYDMYIACK